MRYPDCVFEMSTGEIILQQIESFPLAASSKERGLLHSLEKDEKAGYSLSHNLTNFQNSLITYDFFNRGLFLFSIKPSVFLLFAPG